MSCSCKGVIAVPRVTASHHARESLKIQPQLTDVIRHLADGVLARPGAAHSVGAGVARVPDVGGVGGDGGATCGGADDAADSKSSSTAAIGATSLGRALRAGEAGAIGGGGAGGCALLVGKLDNGEQGELF